MCEQRWTGTLWQDWQMLHHFVSEFLRTDRPWERKTFLRAADEVRCLIKMLLTRAFWEIDMTQQAEFARRWPGCVPHYADIEEDIAKQGEWVDGWGSPPIGREWLFETIYQLTVEGRLSCPYHFVPFGVRALDRIERFTVGVATGRDTARSPVAALIVPMNALNGNDMGARALALRPKHGGAKVKEEPVQQEFRAKTIVQGQHGEAVEVVILNDEMLGFRLATRRDNYTDLTIEHALRPTWCGIASGCSDGSSFDVGEAGAQQVRAWLQRLGFAAKATPVKDAGRR